MNSGGIATHGFDKSSRKRMVTNQVKTLVRHMTARRLVNVLKTEMNRVLKRDIIRSMPFVLKVESTNICNLNCRYCYGGREKPGIGERPFGRMSVDEFKGVIDRIGIWLLKINLYGYGEPLLFPETLDMVRYAVDANIGVTVSSNMNFENTDFCSRIVDSGLETLIVSCHGTTQPVYEQFMTGGSLQRALDNVQGVLDSRKKKKAKYPIVEWQYCVTGFNQKQCQEAVALAQQLGVDAIRFIRPLFPEPPAEQWLLAEQPVQTDLKAPVFRCPWLYRAVFVNYDGGVMPCCRDTRNADNDFGNIFEQDDFSSVWNNEQFQYARRLMSGAGSTDVKPPVMCVDCIDSHSRMAAEERSVGTHGTEEETGHEAL